MNKLLVNTPKSTQEVIEVGEGGGYFDETLVIWDERVDGPLPEDITIGGMIRNEDGTLSFDQSRMDATVSASKPPVPKSVTMRQARLVLLSHNMLDSITNCINMLPSPQKEIAQIEWEFSSEVFRDRDLVKSLTPLLNLTEEQVDDMFRHASQL